MYLKTQESDDRRLTASEKPKLQAGRIGVVSRHYEHVPDFSRVFKKVLRLLDNKGCKIALFSMYAFECSLPVEFLSGLELRNIQAILIDEFRNDDDEWETLRFIVYSKNGGRWQDYSFEQRFGSLSDGYDMGKFVEQDLPTRIMGDVCVLLCGEINGVKYSGTKGKVQDDYGLRSAISERQVQIILNPGHDLMIRRGVMNSKRQFLSKPSGIIVSVWNEGKLFPRNEHEPPWIVFQNGIQIPVERVENNLKVEIGIVDAT
jgi:hypothetical protein